MSRHEQHQRVQMNSTLNRGARTVASGAVMAALALLVCMGAAADDVTSYKIRNRWLRDQYLADAKGTVSYGSGDDATYRWTLEDAGTLQRVRNVGTGAYLSLVAGTSAVTTTRAIPTTPEGQWEIEVGVFPWR